MIRTLTARSLSAGASALAGYACSNCARPSVTRVVGNRRSLASIADSPPQSSALSPLVVPPYARLTSNLDKVRKALGNTPLTLAQKIVYAHLVEPDSTTDIKRGTTYLKIRPDRVAMQDASAQTALLQFMLSGLPQTTLPTSVHCDHLITAHSGSDFDVSTSLASEREVYGFLESASRRYGISFWKPGAGIIHQIVLENYAAPGLLMLGCDSHTPNAGGLGAVAIGVGGADAVDAMAGLPWELRAPKTVGVRLQGTLSGWATPKDLILHLAGRLTVQGGTGAILEYFGPGATSMSCTGAATVCNMGAEVGATSSVFPYSDAMRRYLVATGRPHVAAAADEALRAGLLVADAGSESSYDDVIEIDLAKVEPHVNGPFTPDLATPISKFAEMVKEKGWKDEVKACLIGSCTNSSYQDMSRAANLARQALSHGVKARTEFLVAPGSEQIRATVERDGQLGTLVEVGGKVLANACGPCIGQWKREGVSKDEENAIFTSFNRNFRSRNDGFPNTMNFLASPDIVTAMAFAGRLSFNPITDNIISSDGTPFKFEPPQGEDLPANGFAQGREGYAKPADGPAPELDVEVRVEQGSNRLQLLEQFSAWDGKEVESAKVLVKVKGKCTTDHISAAGKWLKYKGHLQNISENTLIGALNDFTGEVNLVRNEVNGSNGTIPEVAKAYKTAGVSWVVVADQNYGEGSAREHAAMQPRYLGCRLIITRSFARIHETNLKKQGILPLTFVDPTAYDVITPGSTVSTVGIASEKVPSSPIKVVVQRPGLETVVIECAHTMSVDQWEWFKAGSALNYIRKTMGV
ncbi:aconitate hydratase mitochondrial precursor [Gonapodya prolifera JEL478]|uniref:Aconitate hydratase, mitochondrial n=1 Tax=Gonapodya prolifera (strain JEL478) TaxID=1344416 RepID=A0A139B0W5_GONPJ|nr:aconitate hydratase mitochondrial precursor [Gonapodya prolifera JEL478]|eukprot:KXS22443.1 aconitate hydratase mitochondrial precursor [Gonapodya prolifera JEL478]